jgi:mannose-6-phosphate isomerase-like protein (cupin superfamily)
MTTQTANSTHTVKNLKQVENMAPKFDMPEEMQARFARSAMDLEKSGVSHFTLEPNFRIPFGHKHGEQEEVYVVVRGSARVKVDDEIVELGELDALRVAPGVMRQFEGGPDGVEYVVFGTPQADASETEMVPGWWDD